MFTHYGSIDTISNGHAKDGETIEHWSVEKHVDADTAPAFIWHTFDDAAVPIQNTLLYANALAAAGVPFEYHVYPSGVHGLSLANRVKYSARSACFARRNSKANKRAASSR